MGKNHSWEANSRSARQHIPHFYGHRRIITMFIGANRWTLYRATWIQSVSSHLIYLRSILISFSHLLLDQLLSSLVIFRVKFICVSHMSHSWYRPRPSHSPWFDHPNNIWWRTQILKFLIMSFSVRYSYSSFLRSTYSPQHHVLWENKLLAHTNKR
jgi:hypothetical protein